MKSVPKGIVSYAEAFSHELLRYEFGSELGWGDPGPLLVHRDHGNDDVPICCKSITELIMGSHWKLWGDKTYRTPFEWKDLSQSASPLRSS